MNSMTVMSSIVEHDPSVDDSRPRFLTNAEAAAYLRLSPRTLEKHRVNGGGPRFCKFGRSVRYDLADLIRWARARGCEMTTDPEYFEVRRVQRSTSGR